ncbi:hypothetical protein OFN60_32960, partial [Escherichia coli]|nr:hypothetical protein [Escherichia coli]
GPGGEVESSVAVVVDISERKRSEHELEQRVAERTHDLETFTRSVAHDLRSPLRQMEGFAQALLEDYAARLDEPGRLYLRSIAGAAARLDAL